jgi:hypothetical protein
MLKAYSQVSHPEEQYILIEFLARSTNSMPGAIRKKVILLIKKETEYQFNSLGEIMQLNNLNHLETLANKKKV